MLLLFVVAAGLVSFAPKHGLAQSKLGKSLEIGKEFAGVLGGALKTVPVRRSAFNAGDDRVYTSSIPIKLKAGQEISLTATVVGKLRKVGIQLIDPTGKVLTDDNYYARIEEKTSTLTIEEVSTEGTYSIVVFSDATGPFTLRAESDSEEEDIKSLEKKINSLKKQTEELEAKLKVLKEKSKK
jgi:hypothetical protein